MPSQRRGTALLLAGAALLAAAPRSTQALGALRLECHDDPSDARQLSTQACTCPNG